MIAKGRNDEIKERKDAVAYDDRKKYPKRILCASVSDDPGISFYIKEYDNIDCCENEYISAKLNNINSRKGKI